MNHIELFAGCGGLSLGLEKAGFDLVLANELSPMAGETFAYNLLGENLRDLADMGECGSKTFWLNSQFESLVERLRENPFEYPDVGDGVGDIPDEPEDMKGGLLIGNIIHLNALLESDGNLLQVIKSGFSQGGLDLISGGPPCQSFSLAGLRKKDCDKNILPWEFAKFAKLTKPKCVVLENVTGIIRPFKEGNSSYHAWFEIAKVFASIGYVPLCIHTNARLAGVPQNRPRFIMIGVRIDIFETIYETLNKSEEKLFSACVQLYENISTGSDTDIDAYPYYDTHNPVDLVLIKDSFLSPLVSEDEVTVKQAINDLRLNASSRKSSYVKGLNNDFSDVVRERSKLHNHEPRNNSALVQRRFRIYQILQRCSKKAQKEATLLIQQKEDSISNSSWDELKNHNYLIDNGTYREFGRKSDFIKFLKNHYTKKQTQKALDPSLPAPAALSIPDDACHYDDHELRTLTVREMARIQSFPDDFVFRSKVTTGGKMRKFEVPQYTQVGNAVPPLLGLALGKAVRNLLDRI